MSRLNERAIIFALSNPTNKAECTAEQAYSWSKGEALYAAGVQFPDVAIDGKTFRPGQANNFYIFPTIGLATYVVRPRRITDECFIMAAQSDCRPGRLRSFHKKRGLSIEAMVKSRWVYRKLRNFPAGIEANITCLKRAFGLARCTWRGLAHFRSYVWSSVVAYNLVLVVRLAAT